MTEHVESVLRATLVEEADALGPAEDPWPRFARREATHRRVRRVRAAAIAAFLAVAVGVQTNLIPLPGWAPGIAIASGSSALANGPTRGSLAGDSVWLTDLRRQVKNLRDSEGVWKVDQDATRVVYAGDVPGHRLALVLVRLRLGLIVDSSLIWFEGPPGSDPGHMNQSANTNADSPFVTWGEGDGTDGGVLVVIGPAGSTITISGGSTYSAAGIVERRQLPVSGRDGVGVVSVPAAPDGPFGPVLAARIAEGDALIYEGAVQFSSWSAGSAGGQDLTDAALTAAARDARGPALDRAVLAGFADQALTDSHLSARDVTLRLRWSGTVNGQPAALITIQPSGGGVLAYAMHGTTSVMRTDLRLLLPADGAQQRPIAWRMRAEGKDTRTNRVIVVAPPGAAAVTVTVGSGSPAPVTLDASGSGTATVPPDQPAVVTAFSAAGTALASTPVPLFDTDMNGLPGDTPNTRIVN